MKYILDSTLFIVCLCVFAQIIGMEHKDKLTNQQIEHWSAKNEKLKTTDLQLYPKNLLTQKSTTGFITTFQTPYIHFPRLTYIEANGLEQKVGWFNEKNLILKTVKLIDAPGPEKWAIDHLSDTIVRVIQLPQFYQLLSKPDSDNAPFDLIFFSPITWSQQQESPLMKDVVSCLKETFITTPITSSQSLQSLIITHFQNLNEPKNSKDEQQEEAESKEGTSSQVDKEWFTTNEALSRQLTTLDIFPKEMQQQAQGTITQITVDFETPYIHFPFVSLKIDLTNNSKNMIKLQQIIPPDERIIDEEEFLTFDKNHTFDNANSFTDAALDPFILIPALLQSHYWSTAAFSNPPTDGSKYPVIVSLKNNLLENRSTIAHVIRRVGYTFEEIIDVSKWNWLKIMWYQLYHGYHHYTDLKNHYFLVRSSGSGWLKKYRGVIKLAGIAGLAAAGAILYKYKRGK